MEISKAHKARTGLWKAAIFILVNQMLVSITYYGVYNNLTRYLTNVMHESNANSANNVNYWVGTTSITAFIGGFISDSYLGRYWTSVVFLLLYCVSMLLLTLSPAIHSLRPGSRCDEFKCNHASTGQGAFLYFSLYLGAVAAGSYQTCNSSFGADQFDDEDPVEKAQESSYFNYYYAFEMLGSLIASTLVLYIQENVSWAWGFGVCTIAMGLATFSFLLGTKLYRHQPPSGNPLVRILQVFVAAVRKTKVETPSDTRLLYEGEEQPKGCRNIAHTDNLKFLDKAAVVTETYGGSWGLCTVTQVEEAKCILRMLPIFLTSILYSVVYSQMATLFVEQGGTMNTRIGNFNIPPGSLSVFESLSVIVWTIMYERLLVPLFRRYTKREKGLTDLQRIGTGFVIAMLSMIVAGVVERHRVSVATHHGMLDSSDPLPLSVFILVPQYILIGASEVFTFIGLLQFFYDQSPDGIRTIGTALQLCSLALGNYMSSVVVTAVNNVTGKGGHTKWISDNLNRGHIDYFYYLLTVLCFIGFILFLLFSRWYKYITNVSRTLP